MKNQKKNSIEEQNKNKNKYSSQMLISLEINKLYLNLYPTLWKSLTEISYPTYDLNNENIYYE